MTFRQMQQFCKSGTQNNSDKLTMSNRNAFDAKNQHLRYTGKEAANLAETAKAESYPLEQYVNEATVSTAGGKIRNNHTLSSKRMK